MGRNIVCLEIALNQFNSLLTMADTLLLFHKSCLLSIFCGMGLYSPQGYFTLGLASLSSRHQAAFLF